VDDVAYDEGFGDAYAGHGIDREGGCMVAVRPDQYVGWIGEVGGLEGAEEYFAGDIEGAGLNAWGDLKWVGMGVALFDTFFVRWYMVSFLAVQNCQVRKGGGGEAARLY